MWIIFSGKFDHHLLYGVMSAAFVTWLSGELVFEDRSQTLKQRFRQAKKLPGYLVWLLWQIVLANFQVFRLAMFPGGTNLIEPEMVTFQTKLKTDFAKFVLAQSITLTPGTVTVKVHRNEFLVHAISRIAAEGLDGTMERKIAEIYEPEILEASKDA